jgi:hypothetical protein
MLTRHIRPTGAKTARNVPELAQKAPFYRKNPQRSGMHPNLSVFYVEWMQPDWLPSQAQRRTFAIMSIGGLGLIFGLIGGLIGGLALGLVGGLDRITPAEALRWSWREARSKWVLGLVFGLTTDLIETRTIPNEGIRRSLRNALISFLLFGLLFRLVGGLVFGLVSGLINGGSAYLKHHILRFLLWRNDCAPWNYIRFLDYAAERVFLRKVGGGYIFTHRLLMEYFATLEPIEQGGQAKVE